MRYATATRRQPLTIAITTARFDRESICYEQHHYATGVLDGTVTDPSFFASIRAAGPDDDWTDPEVWRRANPSLGITLDAEQFAEDCREAVQSPRKESAFRRYRLNQWPHHAECWLSAKVWERGNKPFDEAMLEGRECCLGIDLARTRDLGAVVLVFPVDGGYYLVPRFYMPSERLAQKEREDHAPYSEWARQRLVTVTEGPVIDYRFQPSSIFAPEHVASSREFQPPQRVASHRKMRQLRRNLRSRWPTQSTCRRLSPRVAKCLVA
jgi:phage terminase large subunit-like protein